MYFAVLGKNPEISMKELELVQPKNISYPKKGIIIFDTEYPERLQQLGGIIKAGSVVKEKDLQTLLADTKIIGIQSEANGKHLKRTAGIRRYKLVDLFHTDREIKTKGKEIINLENGIYGIVEHYQDIELYETVDFGKPGRSMQMGMMPAKLTHIMINIGLNSLKSIKSKVHKAGLSTFDFQLSTVVYDPFVGSGTTGFLANYLGYDFIGSDIKTTYIEQNANRRKTTKFYNKNHSFDIFIHNIKENFQKIGKKKDGNIGKNTEKADKIVNNETIKKILKIVTEIHIKYGNTLTEKQYSKLIEAKIKKEGIEVQREKSITIKDEGITIGTKYIDLIVENQIVIELKNTPYIHKQDLKQTRAYLNLGDYPTGLLINFGESKINIARLEKDYQKTKQTHFSDFSGHFSDISDVLIVTEGRLGPIVTKSTSDQDIQKFQERVTDLYKSFLDRVKELGAVAVFTIPRYVGQDNGIEQILTKYADQIGLKIQSIPELYSREGQQVARKILIVK